MAPDPDGSGATLLTTSQQDEMAAALASGSAPEGDHWTGRTIAAWISQRLGRHVSRQLGWTYLRRLRRWGEEGVWEHIWRAALTALDASGEVDWSVAFLDGSFAPAKKGGDGVGVTKKGKGTKWMLVVDGNGLPLGYHLDSASAAEVTLAERTLDAIRVCRRRGRPKQRPGKLVADRGYDRNTFRRALRRRGIRMCIPPRRHPKSWWPKRSRPVVARPDDERQRFTVERSFAWLGNFRRLLIRWERRFDLSRSFFVVALLLICVRR